MSLETTLHVVPTNDLIEHDTSGEDCICGPRVGPAEAADGTRSWMVVHFSLDNREGKAGHGPAH